MVVNAQHNVYVGEGDKALSTTRIN